MRNPKVLYNIIYSRNQEPMIQIFTNLNICHRKLLLTTVLFNLRPSVFRFPIHYSDDIDKQKSGEQIPIPESPSNRKRGVSLLSHHFVYFQRIIWNDDFTLLLSLSNVVHIDLDLLGLGLRLGSILVTNQWETT